VINPLSQRFLLPVFALIVALLTSVGCFAQTVSDFELPNGEVIPVYRSAVPDSESPVILWLPPHRGIQSPLFEVTKALSQLGIEVWLADLHLAYMVDANRLSVNQFPAADIAALIDLIHQETDREVIVVAMNRGAKNALEGVYYLQVSELPMSVRGVILFSPALTEPSFYPGQIAHYKSIATLTNVPVFVIQAGISTRRWRVNELVDVLGTGGSQVFLQVLNGINSGYLQRPEDDLTDKDLRERAEAPSRIEKVIKLMLNLQVPQQPVAERVLHDKIANPTDRYGLKPLQGRIPSQLNLPDLAGASVSLENFKGKTILVSFWASWCEPCIRELPALNRLQKEYSERGLVVVAVNVGESRQAIEEAVEKYSMHGYVLLQDLNGEEMKRWNVYGFPTNFVINHNGTYSFGSFGAVEWDEVSVRKQIDSIQQEL
jgi:thiol-disulfide isomerase/thioredoxin/pimeloyl-ACP methyl ester carboxylesterase